MSSGLNAIAAVFLEDLIKPCCLSNISARRATVLSKIVGNNSIYLDALLKHP